MKNENIGIIFSIKKEFVRLILEGKKTAEIRKRIPRKFIEEDEDGIHLIRPFKCYIYCTRDKGENPITSFKYENVNGVQIGDKKYKETETGSIVGEFTCDKIECLTTDYRMNEEQTKRVSEESCLSMVELAEYEENAPCLYSFHISNLIIYKKPQNLYNMSRPGAATIDEMADELCSLYCSDTYYGKHAMGCAPNGYYSCEGRYCDKAYQEYLEQFDIKKAPQSWCYCKVKEDWT